ncbi:glycosyltransferase [Gynuella sp.]|uniref:glycosyltransferase n=1 Tax=Gynuella sp. TaxID=2969146 RepID=UPI003D0E1DB8
MKPDIIMFSTADWDNPFWTNKQHVAITLAKSGYKVLYIESIGLRPPSTSATDIKRIIFRIKKFFLSPKRITSNLWVLSPLVIPLQRYRIIRILNKWLLQMSIRRCQNKLGLSNDWLWTYNPMTIKFLDIPKYQKVIYHCVDDISSQPGMPTNIILQSEEELVRKSDVIFCTARFLQEKHLKINTNTYYFGNVADYEHFREARNITLKLPKDMASILEKGPVIGFVGAISSYKVDLKLVRYIAQERPDWQVVLIGKVGEGEPGEKAEDVVGFSNIHLLGPRPYEQLPAYLKGFNVAILPAQLNEYTRSMFPMKFNEYLMAGKDVVAVEIDSLKELTAFYFQAKDYADFILQIEHVLDGNTRLNTEEIENYLLDNTYASRNKKMLNLISK